MPKLVPAEGSQDSPICIVGEAPGASEEAEGRPFVGTAGQRLSELLAGAGLSRSQCLITNVIKERPENNAIGLFIRFSPNSPPKPTQKYEEYESLLWEEIRAWRGNILVPMGKTALWATLRRLDIQNVRGSVFPAIPELGGRKCLSTRHPAASLPNREPLLYPVILHDLLRVAKEKDFPEIRRPERTLRLNPSFFDVMTYIEECLLLPFISFDIETTILKRKSSKFAKDVHTFSLGKSATDALCCSFLNPDGSPAFPIEQEVAILDALARLLESPSVTKLGQNIMFDATYMLSTFGIKVWPILDTMIAHGIAFPDFPKSLGYLTSMFTEEPFYKDTGSFFGYDADWDQALRYSALDSAVPFEIHPKVCAELNRQHNMASYKLALRVHEPLYYMQQRGVRVDQEGLKQARARARAEIREAQAGLNKTYYTSLETLWGVVTEEKVRTAGIWPKSKKFLPTKTKPGFFESGFNPKSHGCVKAYIKLLGFKVPTKRGKETTDKKALTSLASKGFEVGRVMLRISQLRDDLKKYWCARVSADGRIRGAFHVVGSDKGQRWAVDEAGGEGETAKRKKGATPGRFSSTSTIFGEGCNQQNYPVRMKRYLIADEGCILIEADLSQAENRIVAMLANDKRMRNAFDTGQDVHSLTAALISGLPLDKVKTTFAPMQGSRYTWRFWGKKMNHASNYDIGPGELAEQLEITVKESKWLLDSYHKAYPNVRGVFHRDVQLALQHGRALTSLEGPMLTPRTRVFRGRYDHEMLKSAYSFIPQCTVPHIINERGLLPLFERGVDVLNQVHDSVWFQWPNQDVEGLHQTLAWLKTSLEQPVISKHGPFTIPVDFKIGFNMGSMMDYRKEAV